jgi:hypothetical protein
MKKTQSWIGYLDRSYEQIKTALLQKLPTTNPELTDLSETNPLVILISMFAAIAELLNVYIDVVARESYILSAKKFSSMVNLVRLIDYRIKARYPSLAIVTLYAKDPSDLPVVLAAPYFIGQGFYIKTEAGVEFYSTEDVIWEAGTSQVDIPVEQVTLKTNINLGLTTTEENQAFIISSSYVHDSIDITINGVLYTRVDSFARSNTTDTHYIVEIDENMVAIALFGDGVNAIIPPSGYSVIANFKETLGKDVGANTINSIQTAIAIAGVDTITASNSRVSSGGSAFEDVERIRNSAPRSIRTLDRAVSYTDYEDLLLLAPGVGKGKIHFCCGKTIDMYVAPVNFGIAETPLLDSTSEFFEHDRKMITTKINPMPAGISYIILEVDIYKAFRANEAQAILDVEAALLDKLSYANGKINDRVRISDIVAVVDNLVRVDEVEVIKLSVRPYARPKNHPIELLWNAETLEGSTTEVNWKLQYANGIIRVLKDSVLIKNLNLVEEYTDPDNIIKFSVSLGTYTHGMTWEFRTYPINKSIEFTDYTIPVLIAADLTINSKELATRGTC